MVADYMMKFLFQKRFEPQKDWFAKRGVCLHGSMFLFKKEENGELFTEFHDLYSESDDNQNWYFLQAVLRNQSRTLQNFILKCPPSLCGLTMEPTTKILHLVV